MANQQTQLIACFGVQFLIDHAADMERRLGRPYQIPPGSVKGACFVCDTEVWIGPKQQVKSEEGHPILCVECVRKHCDPATCTLQSLEKAVPDAGKP